MPGSTCSIWRFYPQCGFLALGTDLLPFIIPRLIQVSIRNADFWLWEPAQSPLRGVRAEGFYPQCGFLALGTCHACQFCTAEAGFYPQCGFLALGTGGCFFCPPDRRSVSIRNADFWLWERHDYTLWRTKRSGFYPQCGFLALGTLSICGLGMLDEFLSAMRIFGFGNSAPPMFSACDWFVSIRNADFWLWELTVPSTMRASASIRFLSAMRIFGFGNSRAFSTIGRLISAVSIRNADFWLWERQRRAAASGAVSVSIRNADFWLWERCVMCGKNAFV